MKDDKKLNPEQQAAVTHDTGPLLIIAGAGTGKTTVVTQRITHLILDKKVDPKNILALTFTEKASREMQERVDIALPYGYTQMWISTFHSFCDRILRDEAIHIGLDGNYKLATETEMILFLRKHIFDLGLTYFRPLGNPNKFLQGLLQHFSRLKDEDINPEQYLLWVNDKGSRIKDEEGKEEIGKYQELANAYKTFEELKVKAGIMDFADLIAHTLHLFRTRKHILKNYQEKFHHILIDEFQDTNYAQNQLAMLLAGSTKQNITVVGDDDQAIYRWRGAAISNMIQFTKHFPSAKIITLTKNYRSTKSILDSAYSLIQYNNPDRLEIKEKIDKRLLSMRNVAGASVEVLLAVRGDNEADAVVEKIEALIKKSTKNGYSYKDFAILVRANDHAQLFTRALERKRIPFQFLGPGQLFHKEEIKDLIAYLKVLYDFSDSSSLYRVLTMPIWELSGADISVFLHTAKTNNKTLFEVLSNPTILNISEETKGKILNITKIIRSHLERVPKETAGQILYSFLEESKLLQTFIDITSTQQQSVVQNVAKFFERLKTYESEQQDASVFAVVDWIDLSMILGESPLATNTDWAQENAVNILTVHSSKGLEFPVVFVVNLVTQRFPTRERQEQIPIPEEIIKEVLPEGDYHMQEERRLFYVGMTRARDFLFLTAANTYADGKRERKLSPFLSEAVGEKRVEQVKQTLVTNKTQVSLPNMFSKQKIQSSTINDQSSTKINYISYSQIQTFDICPLHYKLRYILKIPTPETAALKIGTAVHGALRDFYLLTAQQNIPSIDEILQNNWSPTGFDSKKHEEEAFTKSRDLIKRYIKKEFDPTTLPLAVEFPFSFPLSTKLKVGGRIDRIDRIDEQTIEIIDYKTGTNIISDKDLPNNLQLTIYCLAVTQLREKFFPNDPENIMLSLYYLENGKKISTTRTKEQLGKAKKEIIAKVEEMQTSDFQCTGGRFCLNCEYKMLCKTGK